MRPLPPSVASDVDGVTQRLLVGDKVVGQLYGVRDSSGCAPTGLVVRVGRRRLSIMVATTGPEVRRSSDDVGDVLCAQPTSPKMTVASTSGAPRVARSLTNRFPHTVSNPSIV